MFCKCQTVICDSCLLPGISDRNFTLHLEASLSNLGQKRSCLFCIFSILHSILVSGKEFKENSSSRNSEKVGWAQCPQMHGSPSLYNVPAEPSYTVLYEGFVFQRLLLNLDTKSKCPSPSFSPAFTFLLPSFKRPCNRFLIKASKDLLFLLFSLKSCPILWPHSSVHRASLSFIIS